MTPRADFGQQHSGKQPQATSLPCVSDPPVTRDRSRASSFLTSNRRGFGASSASDFPKSQPRTKSSQLLPAVPAVPTSQKVARLFTTIPRTTLTQFPLREDGRAGPSPVHSVTSQAQPLRPLPGQGDGGRQPPPLPSHPVFH